MNQRDIGTDHIVKVDSYLNDGESQQHTQIETYDGLPIYTVKGLHAHVFDLISKRLPVGSRMLELGAGGGAMSKRLHDQGYQVISSDLVASNFRLSDRIEFRCADLNLNFSDIFEPDFDAVIAIELIEHIENPRHFFRQVKKLLKPGGYLVVTTPNTESPVSMAYQMRLGHHHWFSDENYHNSGHINPLTSWHFKTMAPEVDMSIDYLGSYGDAMNAVKDWPKMKMLVKLLNLISAPVIHKGEILVCICRKPFE